jgi:hypothetical protein
LDRNVRCILIRQFLLLLCSLVTGLALAYLIGFWPGVILNAIAWGGLIFATKAYSANKGNVDPFRDDRYVMNFILALIARNR